MADAPETPAEAKTRRRRWLTFAEVATVLALAISAASFWDSHQQRQEDRAATAPKPVAVAPLVLTATADAQGNVLRLAAAGTDRVIQTQTIVFPTALAIDSLDTVGNPRIEADWFAGPLRKAVGDVRKHGRLPVGIVTRYTDNGVERTDTAIYDIGHSWRERILASDVPALEGITLVARSGKELRQRLDARWQRTHPAPAKQ